MRLLVLPACGGSPSSTGKSQSPAILEASADPALAYKSVAAKVDLKVHPGGDFLRYCQPITPSSSRQCREIVVQNVAAEGEAIGFLDGATAPEKFKSLHAELRAGIVKGVALHTQAMAAIDSGNGAQGALDAAFANMSKNVFPLLDLIQRS